VAAAADAGPFAAAITDGYAGPGNADHIALRVSEVADANPVPRGLPTRRARIAVNAAWCRW
jgi:hypothetical protein